MTKDSVIRRFIKAIKSIKYGNIEFWNKELVERVLFSHNDIIMHYGKIEPYVTYYFIDLSFYDCGFFAQYSRIMSFLEIADQHDWKPIIQMSRNTYDKNGNTYDCIFEQPFHYGPSDIKKLRNVVFAEQIHLEEGTLIQSYDYDIKKPQEKIVYLRKKYFKYRSNISDRLNMDLRNLLKSNKKKVLGVHYRGGDYFQKWLGHPVVVEISDYFRSIDYALQQGYELIFIATDDLRGLNIFKEKYGTKIIAYEDVVRINEDVGVHYENSGEHLAYEVVRDMYTLSNCEGLIASTSLVSRFAVVEKLSRGEAYKNVIVLNNGIIESEYPK